MKITDITLTLFAWDDIPPTTYGAHTGRFSGKSALGLLRLVTDEGIEGHAFLGSASNAATKASKSSPVTKPLWSKSAAASPAMKASELATSRERVFPRAKHGRVRVGVVSADLFRHSVAYFLEPLLASMPKDRLEIVVLSSSAKEDDVTARLRAHASEWLNAAGMNHDEFAAAARSLGLDVAVDLSGIEESEKTITVTS